MKQKIVNHNFADEGSQNWFKDSKDEAVIVLLFKQAHVPNSYPWSMFLTQGKFRIANADFQDKTFLLARLT